MQLRNFLKRIGPDTMGATAVEYGLIVSLLVLVCVGALKTVAGETIEMWTTVSSKVEGVRE